MSTRRHRRIGPGLSGHRRADAVPKQSPWTHLLDARVLVWLLLLVFLTGVPLMLWFDTDADAHADALGLAGMALRALHAASTMLLVAGTVWHLLARITARRASRFGIRSGALALGAVAVAALSGAMVAQTAAAARLLRWSGLDRLPDAVLWLAVGHIAYATILVLLAVYLHIARWGWRYVFGRIGQAVASLAAVASVALLAGTSAPGSDSVWGGSTWPVAPPVPWLWSWSLVLALGLWLAAGRLASQPRPRTPRQESKI